MSEHPGASVVLAVDEDERVLVLQQYRHLARTPLRGAAGELTDGPLALAVLAYAARAGNTLSPSPR